MVIDVTGNLCIQYQVREWCKLPYSGHPKGCPNYGISSICPPQVCLVNEFIDLTKKHYFIIEEFNLAEHIKKMSLLHPGWTDKQCRCCLYWQNGVRKRLKQKCHLFVNQHPNYIFTLIPEAMGVNVFRTAHRYKLMIRKNPIIVYKVALTGERRLKLYEKRRCFGDV